MSYLHFGTPKIDPDARLIRYPATINDEELRQLLEEWKRRQVIIIPAGILEPKIEYIGPCRIEPDIEDEP